MSYRGPSGYGRDGQDSLRAINPLIFLYEWVHSRPKRYFLRSLPAIGTAVTLAVTLVAGQQRADQMVDYYEDLVQERFQSDDLAAAQLYLEKVAQLDGHNQRRMFNLGLVVEQRGHAKQALQIMQRLAPDHEVRFPPAHRWMVLHIRSSQPNDVDTEQLRFHLTAALSPGKDQLPESQRLTIRDRLAQLAISQRRWVDATRHLRNCFNSDPRFGIKLARVYKLQGEPGLARNTIATAVRTYTTQLNEDPSNVEARTRLAALAAFGEDFPRAEKLLVDGLQIRDLSDSDRAQLRKDIGLFSVQWAAFMAKTKPNSWRLQLALLHRAMETIPNNLSLFNQFSRLTDADRETNRAVVDAMKQVLARGQETALAHWVLGTALVRLDDLSLAEKHLRLAIDADPKLGAGLNNLAWVLAHRKPARLEEASQLIEIALKALPDHPEVRETRGQIYLRMGQLKKAVIDLEFALPRIRDKQPAHLALSRAYLQMGDTALASSHQELARVEQAKLK